MNTDISKWDWNDLATHYVWLKLNFDPHKVKRGAYHAVVFDLDGVQGSHHADTAKDAAAVAHFRQYQNRILYDRNRSIKKVMT